MPRSVPEWVATSDDVAIPRRVKLRIFMRCDGRCAVCTRKPLKPEYDHIVPLIAGGKHAESNIQILCPECHRIKTGQDLASKAVAYRKRLKDAGIKKRKGRPLMGSVESGWKRKITGEWVRR